MFSLINKKKSLPFLSKTLFFISYYLFLSNTHIGVHNVQCL